MPNPEDFEARLTAVEAEAAVARELAAYNDRDLADLSARVKANTSVINALAEQTAGQFAEVRRDMSSMRGEMNTGFTQIAVGQKRIVDLLNRVIDEER